MRRPRGKGLRCPVTTREGNPCPNYRHPSEDACHVHSGAETPRCKRVNSTTTKQCGNPAGESGYCDIHDFRKRASK